MGRPLLLGLVSMLLAIPAVPQDSGVDAADEYAAFRSEYWNSFSAWLTANNAYWTGFNAWRATLPEGAPNNPEAYAEQAGPAPVDPSADSRPEFESWILRCAGTAVEIDARNDLLTILGNQRDYAAWTAVYVGLIAAAPTHERVGDQASSATYVAEQCGRWDEIRELLLGIVREHPQGDSTPGILYAMAERLRDQGDEQGARAYYDRLVADHAGGWYGEQAAAAIYELEELQPGMVAPPFEAVTMDGDGITLRDSLGKVVLLDFWATWCGPCLGEMPNVVDLRESFGSDELVILGVSLDSDKDALTAFLDHGRISGIPDRTPGEAMAWPQLCDGGGWDSALAQLYRVHAIPRTYVIDSAGRIAHKDLRGDELKMALKELISPSLQAEPGKR